MYVMYCLIKSKIYVLKLCIPFMYNPFAGILIYDLTEMKRSVTLSGFLALLHAVIFISETNYQ